MGTITLTYNERNVQVMNLLNYILASGLLVTINPLLFLAESFIIMIILITSHVKNIGRWR
ncbi:hypothetical protein AGMMS50239_39680 [Bacteroidia bacterium]|nr:hypothetical protein AGMMS50239_39680 [Bacteroidia bacterium]